MIVWIRSAIILLSLLTVRAFSLKLSFEEFLLLMVLVSLIAAIVATLRHFQTLLGAMGTSKAELLGYLQAVAYGMPIMLASGFSFLAAAGDRYVAFLYLGPEAMPGYLVMAKLAGGMLFAVAPINLWWPAARVQHLQDNDGGAEFFSNFTPVVLAYYFMAAGILWVLTGALLPWYAPNTSGFDPLVMLILLCSGIAIGMTATANVGTLSPGMTQWLIAITAVAAIVGLGLAAVAIPRWGYLGAAAAAFFAQIVGFILTKVISDELCRPKFVLATAWQRYL